MALRFLEDFRTLPNSGYLAKKGYVFPGNPGFPPPDLVAGPEPGTRAAQFSYYYGTAVRKVLDAQPRWSMGCRVLFNGMDNRTFLSLLDSNTNQVYLRTNTDQQILAYNGAGVLLGQSAYGVFYNTVWNYIEMDALISNVEGFIKVRLNSIPIIDVSNVDTQQTANASANTIEISRYGGGGGHAVYFTDWYACDGTNGPNGVGFQGDCKIRRLYPVGNGLYSDWTPSTGQAFECVDDVTINEVDYISTTPGGNKHLFTVEPGQIVGDVKGVAVETWMKKAYAGNSELRHMLRTNGTDFESSSFGFSTSLVSGVTTWGVNPATGVAWTIAEIDAIQFGVKKQL